MKKKTVRKVRAFDGEGALHTMMGVAATPPKTWPVIVTVYAVSVRKSQRPPHSWTADMFGSGQNFELRGNGPCPMKPREQYRLVRVVAKKGK